MSYVDKDYPYEAYIVEVRYSGDIAIATIRCNDMPKNRDNKYGFTQGFWDYQTAREYAACCGRELQIPCCV